MKRRRDLVPPHAKRVAIESQSGEPTPPSRIENSSNNGGIPDMGHGIDVPVEDNKSEPEPRPTQPSSSLRERRPTQSHLPLGERQPRQPPSPLQTRLSRNIEDKPPRPPSLPQPKKDKDTQTDDHVALLMSNQLFAQMPPTTKVSTPERRSLPDSSQGEEPLKQHLVLGIPDLLKYYKENGSLSKEWAVCKCKEAGSECIADTLFATAQQVQILRALIAKEEDVSEYIGGMFPESVDTEEDFVLVSKKEKLICTLTTMCNQIITIAKSVAESDASPVINSELPDPPVKDTQDLPGY